MKFSRLALVILLCGSSAVAEAQAVSVGPRVGLNLSSFAVKRYNIASPIGEQAVNEMKEDASIQIGPQGGIMVNIAFDDNYSIQPELVYATKGRKQGGQFMGFERDHNIKLNYLEMPLLFKGSLGNNQLKGSIVLGPYFGYLLNGTDSYEFGGKELRSGSLNYDFTEKNPDYFYNRYDFGGTIGGEVSYRTGKNTFFLDARYSLGTKDVFGYHPDLSSTAVRIRNRTVGISIGWLFHFEYTPKAPRQFEGMDDDEEEEELPAGPKRDSNKRRK